SEGVHYCFDDQELKDAADQMKSEKVRRLVVVNRDKRLVGMCSIGDIVVLGDKSVAGDVLEGVSEPVKK
ncbi:MAG: CBS domain-containing protein, partial [candidate division Zixibacteria bacterium]|nr:CBS domain-containing protein [candidate division Zixibacteria bacterium]